MNDYGYFEPEFCLLYEYEYNQSKQLTGYRCYSSSADSDFEDYELDSLVYYQYDAQGNQTQYIELYTRSVDVTFFTYNSAGQLMQKRTLTLYPAY